MEGCRYVSFRIAGHLGFLEDSKGCLIDFRIFLIEDFGESILESEFGIIGEVLNEVCFGDAVVFLVVGQIDVSFGFLYKLLESFFYIFIGNRNVVLCPVFIECFFIWKC